MLSTFLRGKRSQLILQVKEGIGQIDQRYNFIFGNESCDHDSAISSLIYAWFCSKISQGNNQTQHIPVFNIKEDRFRLKTETVYLLQKYGVDRNDLIFRDTINFEELFAKKPHNVEVTLLDHHVLQRSDEFFSPYITEIIDHRPQARHYDGLEISVEIALVGSCMTLIAERVLCAIDSQKLIISQSEMNDLSSIMSGPILLDTVNLSLSAGKVTLRDREVIRKLWKDESEPHISTLFKELSDAKFFVDGLTSLDILLKDMKTIESSNRKIKVVFSTMHISLGKFFENESSRESVSIFTKEEKAHLWVALFPGQQDVMGKPFKPIVLFSVQSNLGNEVLLSLQNSKNPQLELDVNERSIYGESYIYLRMYNVSASRKQVLPVVEACIG